MRALILCLAVSIAPTSTIPEEVGDYTTEFSSFLSRTREDPVTRDGYWIETLNALEIWEKVILVFGYAGRGDEAVCNDLASSLRQMSSGSPYRCVPVN